MRLLIAPYILYEYRLVVVNIGNIDLKFFYSLNQMFHLTLSRSFIHAKSLTILTVITSKLVFLLKFIENLDEKVPKCVVHDLSLKFLDVSK